ncbi:MAG TPA: ABC transporter permease [Phycisphaerae bacterium]|nr:ABC transporter permease [Phycisphaerae bacterium]
MLMYLLRRLLLMIPTLIGMTLLLFCIVRFAPGVGSAGAYGEGGQMRNQQARAAVELALKKRLHLVDKSGKTISLPMQYTYWFKDTFTGDFGDSVQYNEPVLQLLKERIPVTIVLNILSTAIVYLIAIPGGMLAAVRRGRFFDVSWNFFTLGLFSLPIIWVGGMLVGFLANPRYLGWFPAAGIHSTNTEWMTSTQYAGDYVWHIVLPVLCLSYAGFAYLSKIQRAAMLDNLGLDYVRTARAKGVPEHIVITRHVFRNSLLPMITLFAGIIPGLLGGSVVVEHIFSIKGMGDLMLNATLANDLPIVQAVAFIGSIISLICLLITDICYAVADPRVSYE